MVPAPGDVQATGHNVEATKTEPDKNTYLVLARPERRRPELRLRHALPLPGPRAAASPGYITRINLDADGAHRVTLLATADSTRRSAAGRSTARPGIRSRSACCSRTENGAERRRLAGDAGRSRRSVEDISGVARPRRLRGHPERLERQPLDRRGRRRRRRARCNTIARQPNSFVYRFLPNDPRDLDRRQAAGAAGDLAAHARPADRVPRRTGRRRHPLGRRRRPAHLRQGVHRRAGSRSTTRRRRHGAVRRQRAGEDAARRRRSSGPRTASSGPARTSPSSSSTRPATRTPRTRGRLALRRLRRHPQADAVHAPAATPASCRSSTCGDVVHTGLDNIAFWDDEPRSCSSRTPATACTPSATRSTRPGSSTCGRLLEPGDQPARGCSRRVATRRPRSTPRLGGRRHGFQNEGDNEITGFHVSDGDPTTRGILGAKLPQPLHDAAGASSTPSSTATTSPGRSSRRARARRGSLTTTDGLPLPSRARRRERRAPFLSGTAARRGRL